MKKIRGTWNRSMTRPTVLKALARFLYALTAALLWDHFVNTAGDMPVKAYAFVFLGFLFAAAAWIVWLRLDGIKMPSALRARVPRPKKPFRSIGGIADYMDEPVVSFEEMTDDERDVCRLIADVSCSLLFFVLSVC